MASKTLGLMLTCAAAATALGACGSSDDNTAVTKSAPAAEQVAASTIPKAQLIRRGDAICEKGNATIGKVKAPNFDPAHATAKQLKSGATFADTLAKTIGSEVRDVAALGTPDSDAATFSKAIADSRAYVASLRGQADAAKAGDVRGFRAAMKDDDADQSGTLLARFGFKVCGQG